MITLDLYQTYAGEARKRTVAAPPACRAGAAAVASGLLLDSEHGQGVVGRLHRLGMLALAVKLLGFVQLGGGLLDLRVVRLHRGGRVLSLLDQGRALERGSGGGGQCETDGGRGYGNALRHRVTPFRAGLAITELNLCRRPPVPFPPSRPPMGPGRQPKRARGSDRRCAGPASV